MTITPKAICVGPDRLASFLAQNWDEWDWQPSVRTPNDMLRGLNNHEIDNDIHLVFVFDGLFDPSGRDSDFEFMVASLAPYCFMGIINYSEESRGTIYRAVEREAVAAGEEGAPNFYFISKNNPRDSLYNAIEQFKKESQAESVIRVLNGEDPDDFDEVGDEEREASAATFTSPEVPTTMGQVVAVTSSKGGSGKTTIAVSLATFLTHSSANSAREGLEQKPLKVCVADFDPEIGHLGLTVGMNKPNIVHLLKESVIDEDSVSRNMVHDDRLMCDLLLAPNRPRNAREIPMNFYRDVLQVLRRMYDYVILDTSTRFMDPLLEAVAYPQAHQIVFVTDIVNTSVYGMAKWIQEVSLPKEKYGMDISKGRLGIVVNKAMKNINMSEVQLREAAQDVPIISVFPSLPRVVAHSINMYSLDVLLTHKDWRPAVEILGRAIVGDKYKLSRNLTKPPA